MKYTVEFNIDNFEFWSGAEYTIETVKKHGKMDELQSHIEEIFECASEPPTKTDINDYVWFHSDDIFEALGINEDEDEDEE